MVQGPLAPASLRTNESYVRFHGQQVGSGMKRFICAAEQKAAERGSGCQSSEVRSESKVGASSVVDRAPTQARSVTSAGTRLSGAVYRVASARRVKST